MPQNRSSTKILALVMHLTRRAISAGSSSVIDVRQGSHWLLISQILCGRCWRGCTQRVMNVTTKFVPMRSWAIILFISHRQDVDVSRVDGYETRQLQYGIGAEVVQLQTEES